MPRKKIAFLLILLCSIELSLDARRLFRRRKPTPTQQEPEEEVDIEEDGLKILALHQPVATDLRFIVAVLKINNDLERIGDLAVNIAERAIFLANHPIVVMSVDLVDMAHHAQSMLKESLDALINHDAKLAHQIFASDDFVDDMNRQMVEEMRKKSADADEDFKFSILD